MNKGQLSYTHPSEIKGGFSYDLCLRNQFLKAKGLSAPLPLKTGTTIAGAIFKGGVVLGADTRATEGPIVCDKNCEKIHYIAPTIYCCGAGTSADTENVTGLISSQLKLHSLSTGRNVRVITAKTLLSRLLFRYQGHVSAALVLGGVDTTGSHLCSVWPHGSTDELPYLTMGSGSLAAMAVFEDGWHEDMTKDECAELVHQAIRAGIFNDLGSGGNVDLMIITKDGVQNLRNMDIANPRLYRHDYTFKKGTTTVLKQFEVVNKKEERTNVDEEKMQD